MWPNPHEAEDVVIFPEEILNEKLHFMCTAHDTAQSFDQFG